MLAIIFVLPLTLNAQGNQSANFGIQDTSKIPMTDTSTKPPSNQTIQNPLGNVQTIPALVSALLGIVLQIGVPVAVFFLILAGFFFVSARGDVAKLTKAKSTFMWTIVGIALLVGAEALIQIIQATINQLK